jgi:hypothetical protein
VCVSWCFSIPRSFSSTLPTPRGVLFSIKLPSDRYRVIFCRVIYGHRNLNLKRLRNTFSLASSIIMESKVSRPISKWPPIFSKWLVSRSDNLQSNTFELVRNVILLCAHKGGLEWYDKYGTSLSSWLGCRKGVAKNDMRMHFN